MGEFASELQKLIKPNKLIDISVFGFDMSITDSVVMMWIVMAALIIFSLVFTRKLKTIPEGKQSVVEVIVEFVYNFANDSMGHNGKLFAPYIGTVLMFLVVSNIIAIFNVIPSSEDIYHWTGIEYFKDLNFAIRPPTKDVNVTLTLALMSMVAVALAGIKVKKMRGWLKSFVEPVPLMLPFKMLDYVIRPVSLCFRMFGNILGAVIIMELVYFALPAVLPAFLSIYFDLFDGILQAYVFAFLTSIYIGEAIE
ncbi:MAG TPA: F0F1 ATP synthase subunit A [Acetivibrio sp.]|uniref:F0F1 ATP synthase subunit A n=1 Tax=Acetivibrio sp. TaxID=1872092 RepID=UPI002C099007|nr:F0F1 ATP synthase subunit A [Acetivibrio sp.]HOM03524.1 F0F1 ATP synthase subunit A [Acetivibrio sp.]